MYILILHIFWQVLNTTNIMLTRKNVALCNKTSMHISIHHTKHQNSPNPKKKNYNIVYITCLAR